MVMTAQDTKSKSGYKQTEVGLIPEDWEVKSLGSITTLITNGFVGKATDFYTESDDGVLYIQGYNVEENMFNLHGVKRVSLKFHVQHQKSCLRAGDLLTIQTGDIGITTVVPNELVGANCHALVISRLDKRFCVPQYYCQYFNSKRGRDAFKEIETGTTMKHLNVGDMKMLFLPSPPQPEQQAIATALSDVDALIASLDKLIAKKCDIKQATMQQLLAGKTRLLGFGEEQYKQTEAGLIPEDWKIEKLGDIAKIYRGASPRPSRFVKQENLIMSICATVGKPIITRIDVCIHDGFVIFETPKVNIEYLYYYLSSIESNWSKNGQTGSQMNLNTTIIGNENISFPDNPEEQRAIATVLSDMDAEIVALEQKREKTRDLKLGMMQELLSGKTRLL